MCTQPWPFVRKNKSLLLFHAISFTSKLNCSSARILCVRVSMNVTKSSLLPTAIVLPSGDHVMLIFSPFVLMVVAFLPARTSQMRTVLSPLAVLSRSGSVACQHNWSTDPVWPRNVVSLAYGIRGNKLVTFDLCVRLCVSNLPNDLDPMRKLQPIYRMNPKPIGVHHNSIRPNGPKLKLHKIWEAVKGSSHITCARVHPAQRRRWIGE